VMLSIILTASVLFPAMSGDRIVGLLVGGCLLALFTYLVADGLRRRGERSMRGERKIWMDSFGRMIWRMPPLAQLPPAQLTLLTGIWLGVLRFYLVVAGGLVLWRIVELAISAG
jgi:hypothetical protein